MPIIKRIEKTEKTNVGVRIEIGLAAKLKKYAEYTNVPPATIVATAIEHVINSDPEFMQTLGHHVVSKKLAVAKSKGQATGA